MAKLNGCRKGKAGERELAGVFREAGFPAARRGQQRSGLDQPDVIGGPPGWHWECKRVESLNVWAAFQQADRDAGGVLMPAVAMRRSKGPWLAVVRLGDLLSLLRRLQEQEVARLLS